MFTKVLSCYPRNILRLNVLDYYIANNTHFSTITNNNINNTHNYNNNNNISKCGQIKFIIKSSPNHVNNNNSNINNYNSNINKNDIDNIVNNSVNSNIGFKDWIISKLVGIQDIPHSKSIISIFSDSIIPLIFDRNWSINCSIDNTNKHNILLLLTLHVWLIHTRLRDLDTNNTQSSRLIFNLFWEFINNNLYNGNLLSTEVTTLTHFIYPIMAEWDNIQLTALHKRITSNKPTINNNTSNINQEFEYAWLACIWRTIYDRKPDLNHNHLKQLYHYIQSQLVHIHQLPPEQLLSANHNNIIKLLPPPTRSVIINNNKFDYSVYNNLPQVNYLLMNRYLKWYNSNILASVARFAKGQTNDTDTIRPHQFAMAGKVSFTYKQSQ
jgi:hypothetical protein